MVSPLRGQSCVDRCLGAGEAYLVPGQKAQGRLPAPEPAVDRPPRCGSQRDGGNDETTQLNILPPFRHSRTREAPPLDLDRHEGVHEAVRRWGGRGSPLQWCSSADRESPLRELEVIINLLPAIDEVKNGKERSILLKVVLLEFGWSMLQRSCQVIPGGAGNFSQLTNPGSFSILYLLIGSRS